MTKLSDTEFARKLANAPRTSLAAQVAESERLLAAEQTTFAGQLVSMVDVIAAAAVSQDDADRDTVRSAASDIAGASGLMGKADVAEVASGLAQMCDEMEDGGWSWKAVGVFAQTLSLLTNPESTLSKTDRALLVDQLTTVRATLKTRAGRIAVSA